MVIDQPVSNTVNTNPKPTKKLKISGKKAALGVAGLALATAGINKLRKSRSDKGKIRGKYSK